MAGHARSESRDTLRRASRVVALALVFAATADPARAEIKEYQIRRMLIIKTECQVIGLEPAQLEGDQHLFHAECENVSHYPEGVDIRCPQETEDDRECTVLTAKRDFRHLEKLRQ